MISSIFVLTESVQSWGDDDTELQTGFYILRLLSCISYNFTVITVHLSFTFLKKTKTCTPADRQKDLTDI